MERYVQLSLAAAREAVDDAGLDGAYDPLRVGIIFGSAIGGIPGIVEQVNVLQERGHDRVSPFFLPSVLVDTASGQLAISLGFHQPRLCLSRRARQAPPPWRRRSRAPAARACGRSARGRRRVVHPSVDPRRLLCDAWSR